MTTEQSNTQAKLLSETALIAWHDLQRFFAQGVVIEVANSLDLVVVASLLADDQATALADLIEQEQVAYPSNEQARRWYQHNTQLWSVVVAPYVLVQEKARY